MILRNATSSQRRLEDTGLLILNEIQTQLTRVGDLPHYLKHGDVLVVNDAATLPASLSGRHLRTGREIEMRLMMPLSTDGYQRWRAVLFGEGDWRTPTEHRPLPPELNVGDRLEFAGGLTAQIEKVHAFISSRFVSVVIDSENPLAGIYSAGRPIQYSYLKEELAIWDQQTIFAGPPVALEPPSASFALSWSMLIRLRASGVSVVPLTHGTGISSTGDVEIDKRLPMPERYRIPLETQTVIRRARKTHSRVIAVGTGVVRALESWAGRDIDEGWRFTDLKLSANYQRRVVDGLLTGMHDPQASHLDLLRAFLNNGRLNDGYKAASRAGFLWHEYGDATLVIAG